MSWRSLIFHLAVKSAFRGCQASLEWVDIPSCILVSQTILQTFGPHEFRTLSLGYYGSCVLGASPDNPSLDLGPSRKLTARRLAPEGWDQRTMGSRERMSTGTVELTSHLPGGLAVCDSSPWGGSRWKLPPSFSLSLFLQWRPLQLCPRSAVGSPGPAAGHPS